MSTQFLLAHYSKSVHSSDYDMELRFTVQETREQALYHPLHHLLCLLLDLGKGSFERLALCILLEVRNFLYAPLIEFRFPYFQSQRIPLHYPHLRISIKLLN